MRDGQLYFGTDQISSSQIAPRIREGVSSGAEHRVYLRADARVRYYVVKTVLEAVQSAGVEDISIFANE